MKNPNATFFFSEKHVDMTRIKQLMSMTVPRMWTTGDESLMIRPQVVKAICKLEEISSNSSAGGLGVFQMPNQLAGYSAEIEDDGNRYCVAAIPDVSGTFCKVLVSKGNSGVYNFGRNHTEDGAVMLTTLLFRSSMEERPDSEIVLLIDETISGIRNLINVAPGIIPDSLACSFAKLSEFVFKKFQDPNDSSIAMFNAQGNVEKLSSWVIDAGKYAPTRVIRGSFTTLCQMASNYKPSPAAVKVSEATAAVREFGHEYSEEEQKLIPELPSWYVDMKEVNTICSLIKATSNKNHPMRNFMLRGPSSVGKSTMAKAVAAILHVPYVFVTCAADTESYLFFGQPMYDRDGSVKYVDSPFIQGIKGGYVVEIQEPYVIAKQGILTSLNSLLDDGQATTLSTGEIVKRHPDAITIFTTNVDYVACKKPNQSVLRRMNATFDIQMPDPQSIAARVAAVTEFSDMETLSTMISLQRSILEYLKKEEITDGVCGTSELIDWVEAYQCTHDLFESASFTIVSKATDDPEVQTIISGLIETKFEHAMPQPVSNLSY